MCSKKKIILACFLFIVHCVLYPVHSFSEVVNQVVAVVNKSIITLTDLEIARTLGLFEHESEAQAENPLLFVLQRMVDQQVVIDANKETIPVEEKEIDAALNEVVRRLGREEFEKRLERFDLAVEDFQVYLVKEILFHKILSGRFGKGVSVSLEEIEAYYTETYVPAQEKKGLQTKPMMELLDEIESEIKQKKIKLQIDEWIHTLKEQAEVEIRFESVMEIKE